MKLFRRKGKALRKRDKSCPSRYERAKLAARSTVVSISPNRTKSSAGLTQEYLAVNKRDKRSVSYFEPIYDPSDRDSFPATRWNINRNDRNYHLTLRSVNFIEQIESFEKEIIVDVTFCACDFDGDFTQASPSFKNCEFDKCDFGLSIWQGARFKRCKFFRSSFSVATFFGCEFRDCTFVESGLSGNETVLTGTIFTNPTEFINSAYLSKDEDILFKKETNLEYQSMRLDGTKASIARTILANSVSAGSEKTYYEIAKFYQNQSITAKISNIRYRLATSSALDKNIVFLASLYTLRLERAMIKLIGKLNNWGESVAKPTIIGAGIILFFTFVYLIGEFKPSFWTSLEASIDISLLIGYTKHANLTLSSWERFAYSCNMVLGLVWYSVFVPTIIGRVSRIR